MCQQAAVLSLGDLAAAASQAACGDVSAGLLAFQSWLTPEPSSPFAGRELLFLHRIWLSPEPAPFWPQHFFPLLCNRAYQDRVRQVATFSGIWFVLLGKQHYTTIHAWDAVEQCIFQPSQSCPSLQVRISYVSANKSVDALRPEARRLLVCSCEEYKQLQRISMDISLQHSSECTACWFRGQNEFAHLSGVWGLRRDPKITSYDTIHRVMG